MGPDSQKLVQDYLGSIAAKLKPIPDSEIQDIVMEISAHIHDSLPGGDPTVEQVLEILNRLGAPSLVSQKYREAKGIVDQPETINRNIIYTLSAFAVLFIIGIGISVYLINRTRQPLPNGALASEKPRTFKAHKTNPIAGLFAAGITEKLGAECTLPGNIEITVFSGYYEEFLKNNRDQLEIIKRPGELTLTIADIPLAEKEIYRRLQTIRRPLADMTADDLFLLSAGYGLIALYYRQSDFSGFEPPLSEAAQYLALLENAAGDHDQVRLLKSLLWYLSGEVNTAVALLADRNDATAVALRSFLTWRPVSIKADDEFSALLKCMTMFNDDRRQGGITAGRKLLKTNPDVLYPMLEIASEAEIGEPLSPHFLTRLAYCYILEMSHTILTDTDADGREPYHEPTEHGTDPRLKQRFNDLKNLQQNPPDTLTRVTATLLLKYFRKACYERYRFLRKTWGVADLAETYVGFLAATIADEISVFIEGAWISGQDKNQADDRFESVFLELNDPYFMDKIISHLNFKQLNEYVNHYQDIAYPSCWAQAYAGSFCTAVCWRNKIQEYYWQARQLNDYLPPAYFHLALHDFDEKIINQGRALMPESMQMKNLAGRYYLSSSFSYADPGVDTAVAIFREVVAEVDDRRCPVSVVINLYKATGRYQDAADLAIWHYQNNPRTVSTVNIYCQAGWMYLKWLNQPKKAFAVFNEIVDFGTGSGYIGIAESYEKLGDMKTAEEFFETNLDRYGNRFSLAAFYLRRKEYDKLDHVLAEDKEWSVKEHRRKLFDNAFTFYEGEAYPSLVKRFYEKIYPNADRWNSSYDFTNLATAYICLNETGNAEKILRHSIELNQTNPFTFYLLLVLQMKRGTITDGMDLLDKVEPRDYHADIVEFLKNGGDLEKMIHKYDGYPMRLSYLSTFYGLAGYKLMHEGKKEKAREFFRIDSNPVNCETWCFPLLSNHELKLKKVF